MVQCSGAHVLWLVSCCNCFIVVWHVDILKSIFKYAHIGMIMMEHFLQFSDYVHWQVFTNMRVLLLGLLICISHEVHLKELWILLWKWKQSSKFMVALALNLECGVKSCGWSGYALFLQCCLKLASCGLVGLLIE